MSAKWPTWLVSYGLDGSQWSMSIVARDAEDAKRRLAAAAQWGKVDGELIATVPMVAGGFLVPIVTWFRNLFVYLRRAAELLK